MDSSISRRENDITTAFDEALGDTGRKVSTTEETEENQYMKHERMMEEIVEQAKQQSLTSHKVPIATIKDQYNDNPNFITGINILEQTYDHIRTIRGDGNCYYRAFLYSLLECLIHSQQQHQEQKDGSGTNTTNGNSNNNIKAQLEEGQRILQYVNIKSWQDILHQNYDEMAIEIFHDEMMELFQNAVEKKTYNQNNDSNNNKNNNNDDNTLSSTTFHSTMNEENSISDYCTWYLRLVTATHIKQDPDRFLPFVISSSSSNDIILDIQQFCCKYIEPMGQECEHVQVLALAEAFQINVTVVYLDGRQPQQQVSTSTVKNHLPHHSFGPDTSPIRLTLLYRPGHYDILYEKQKKVN